MDTKDKIEVMNHFLNGGDIEFIMKDYPEDIWEQWKSDREPVWDWSKFDYRIKKEQKFRLPTREEFEALIDNFSKWDKQNKGLLVENEDGDILFFPAAGFRYGNGNGISYEGAYGYYWCSTCIDFGMIYAYNLYFKSNCMDVTTTPRRDGNSIRLVSDEPFEGGVEFNGIWWKRENEDGYFTYDEAMEKFNNEEYENETNID